jgi:leader peptidase (prepilin peptidase)/N-methyltransferase
VEWLLALFAFAFGAIIGSFLNVVIHRYPAGESLVAPRSYCPGCRTPIRPYDNIPVLSWLLLRGRCRSCDRPISIRYPLVELANGLFYLAIYLHTGISISFPILAAIVSMTIALLYIDLDIQILPDVIDLPGIVLGLVIGYLKLGMMHPTLILASSISDSLIGAALGGGTLLLIATVYKLVRRIEGMGLGDVKMLAMIGAVVGWRPLLPLLFLASFAGAVLGLVLAARSSRGLQLAIPFGVFLGLAALSVIFAGNLMGEVYHRMLLR